METDFMVVSLGRKPEQPVGINIISACDINPLSVDVKFPSAILFVLSGLDFPDTETNRLLIADLLRSLFDKEEISKGCSPKYHSATHNLGLQLFL